MAVLRWLGFALLGIVLLVVAAFGVARLSDGPIAMIPGGPLEAGELVGDEVRDWNFANAHETIEFQLEGDGTSRTVWIVVRDGVGFIPCSIGFPPGKSWYQRVERDTPAIVRIDGKRYPVALRRVEDDDVQAELGGLVEAKYTNTPPSDAGVWFFAIFSRRV